MATPAELALELLAAFDADYDTRRQALVDALVTAGLIEIEEEADEEPKSYTPWGVEKISFPVPSLGEPDPEPDPKPAPKPSQVERINEIARQREQRPGVDPRTMATEEERVTTVLAAIERGESPKDALVTAYGYTPATAQFHLSQLRKKGLVPPSERSAKAAANLPRPGFDLDAARDAIEGAA
jgi:DNA-binding transcriptional ArsR family regulator